MTDLTNDTVEAKQFTSGNTLQSAASGRMLDEVQTYQTLNQKNSVTVSVDSFDDDKTVKKTFNGEEVKKILSDCVINHDELGAIKPSKTGEAKPLPPNYQGDDLGEKPSNFVKPKPSGNFNDGNSKLELGQVNGVSTSGKVIGTAEYLDKLNSTVRH